MEFKELLEKRFSSRTYTSRRVSEEAIEEILLAIESAPSAGNLQSYRVVIVRDVELRQKLAEASRNQLWMVKAPIHLVFFADIDQYQSKFAEHLIEVTPLQDATIAMAYAQLAAANLGLGTCWVASHAWDTAQEILELEGNLILAGILAVGYTNENQGKRKRRGPEHWAIEISIVEEEDEEDESVSDNGEMDV